MNIDWEYGLMKARKKIQRKLLSIIITIVIRYILVVGFIAMTLTAIFMNEYAIWLGAGDVITCLAIALTYSLVYRWDRHLKVLKHLESGLCKIINKLHHE